MFSHLDPVLHSLIAALHERDSYTRHHAERVATLCDDLGRACSLSGRELSVLRIAALCHDIGKIGVPDQVLYKPGFLNQDELELMHSHSIKGERIFRAIGLPIADEVAQAIRNHHEQFDGGGYPDGLRGEAIPVTVRILSVADAYDAMASTRPYRDDMAYELVVETLEREQGSKFDPAFVRALFRQVGRDRPA